MLELKKATIQRLKNFKKEWYLPYNERTFSTIPSYCDVGFELHNVLLEQEPHWTGDNEDELFLIVNDESLKKSLSGLSTKFPAMVSTTFTHGNNACTIKNIDRLIRELAD